MGYNAKDKIRIFELYEVRLQGHKGNYVPSLHVGLLQHIYRMEGTVEQIDILTLTEFRSWYSNEKYSNLWQTEHRILFVLIQRRYPLYLQASRSDARLLSRVLIYDGMDFSERKNFVREICVCGK